MEPLCIMTWNVRYFGHGLGGLRATEGWMRRMAERVAALDQIPDVIALQEVETSSLRAGLHDQPQLDRFLGFLHDALHAKGETRRFRGLYFPAHRYGFGASALYTTGLAWLVAEHVELDEEQAIHDITSIPESRFSGLKQRRIAAHVRLRAGGEEVDLFNTHLSLPSFSEVGMHRIPDRMGHGSNQLREVDRLLEFVDRRAGRHAVVVGDFNTLPDSPAYRSVTGAGLEDAFARTTGMGLDAMLKWGTARFLHRRMHIDHVFSTGGLRWLSFAEHHVDAGPLVGLSDHAPKLGWLTAGSR